MAISKKHARYAIRLPLTAAGCLLGLLAGACSAAGHDSATEADSPVLGDAGQTQVAQTPDADSPALGDAGQTELAPAPDAGSASAEPAQNTQHEDQASDAGTLPAAQTEPIAKTTDVVAPVVPTTPASPTVDQPAAPALPALPPPSAGVCAFIAATDTAPSVDNANCPDGVLHGDLTIGADADVAAAVGCTRVTGNVYIYTSYVSSISGLTTLREIDGDLTISEWSYAHAGGMRGTQTLDSLQPLGQLACVAGSFMLTVGPSLPDATGLDHLTEVGGDVEADVFPGSGAALPALRRVWGNTDIIGTIDAPALETVYGNILHSSLTTTAAPYVGCAASEYCRDGVLGCSYTANSQASLSALSKCEYAVHDISVQGADIDLTPLAQLTHVGGRLTLSAGDGAAGQLRHLEALSKLKYVRQLQIAGFPELSDLSWLPDLSSAQIVDLADLPALVDLHDLSGITTLLYLDVTRSGLHSLKGLDNLEALYSLTLTSNDQLSDLSGAPQLRDIGWLALVDQPSLHDLTALSGVAIGDLTVKQLPMLESLAGLEGVQSSVDTLTIDDNATLRSVEALAALRQVSFLDVSNNPQLASFRGLDGLTAVSYSATVTDNPLLPQCALQSLATLHRDIDISENDTTATCE